jgi:hypothetical protein
MCLSTVGRIIRESKNCDCDLDSSSLDTISDQGLRCVVSVLITKPAYLYCSLNSLTQYYILSQAIDNVNIFLCDLNFTTVSAFTFKHINPV